MKVAVTCFDAKLYDVLENRKKAEKLIRTAAGKKAEMILFPEFFTTGFSFGINMYKTVLDNLDHEEWVMALSKKQDIIIGGSWISYEEDGNAYNVYGLAFPSGEIYKHKKEVPTGYENFCCARGDKNIVFETPIGRVGIVMGNEILRRDTYRRMMKKVDLVVAGSYARSFSPKDTVTYEELNIIIRHVINKGTEKLSKELYVPVLNSSLYGNYLSGTLRSIEYKDIIESVTCSVVYDKGKIMNIKNDRPGIMYVNISLKKDINHKKGKIPQRGFAVNIPDSLRFKNEELNRKFRKFYNETGKSAYFHIYSERINKVTY